MAKEKEIDFTNLENFINQLEQKDDSALIEVLHFAQNEYGYLPRAIQIFVSEKLNIPVAKIYGVITFYSYFTDTPRGDFNVQVCIGTGCFVKGADRVLDSFEQKLSLKSGQTSADMKFTLSGVRCVGACGLAPVVIVNEKVYGHVAPEGVNKIVETYLVEEVE